MWALIVTITLNLQSYPLFTISDGSWVYMRTTSFRVAIGHFATKADCEAYVLPPNMEFALSGTDEQGNPESVAFTNVPATVVGCNKVL